MPDWVDVIVTDALHRNPEDHARAQRHVENRIQDDTGFASAAARRWPSYLAEMLLQQAAQNRAAAEDTTDGEADS